jgi:hypothetical protein
MNAGNSSERPPGIDPGWLFRFAVHAQKNRKNLLIAEGAEIVWYTILAWMFSSGCTGSVALSRLWK